MSVETARKITEESDHPLERLSTLLSDDMDAVNALIIGRLHSDVEMIPQLASYLIAAGGKRIRPLLTIASARLLGDKSPRPYGLAAAVEFIHTATLLHDDVVDESEERRGQPAANLIFGNQPSILVGDFLFARSFQLMVEDGSLEVLRLLSDASAIITEGEVMQLSTVNNIKTTQEEYEQVIMAKTAALFAAACEIGPVVAGAGEDTREALREFGTNLGMAFQIVDDVLDYSADQAKLGKTVGDDFREGKMTAPVIISLIKASEEERAFWQRTIEELDQRDGDLERAQEIIRKHDGFEKSLHMAKDHATRALLSLERLPENDIRDTLADLVRFTVDRDF